MNTRVTTMTTTLLGMLQATALPEQLAFDGFDYPAGRALAGQDGGEGRAGAWRGPGNAVLKPNTLLVIMAWHPRRSMPPPRWLCASSEKPAFSSH